MASCDLRDRNGSTNCRWPELSSCAGVSLLLEYFFLVPANRIGFHGNDGPFSLMQLKVIQEVISLLVFTVFTLVFFKTEALRWNHAVAFILLVLAVYFIFKK